MLTKKQKMQILATGWEEDLRDIVKKGCEMLDMGHLVTHIELKFSTAMKTNGGTAKTKPGEVGGTIAINVRLCYNTLIKEGPEKAKEHREATFWHELAHILANTIAGCRAGHGPVWKRTMRRLGRIPDRCHRQDVTELKSRQRRYRLLCSGCGYVKTLTAAKRTRMKNKILRILDGDYGFHPRCPRCCRDITIADLESAKKVRLPTVPPPPQPTR